MKILSLFDLRNGSLLLLLTVAATSGYRTRFQTSPTKPISFDGLRYAPPKGVTATVEEARAAITFRSPDAPRATLSVQRIALLAPGEVPSKEIRRYFQKERIVLEQKYPTAKLIGGSGPFWANDLEGYGGGWNTRDGTRLLMVCAWSGKKVYRIVGYFPSIHTKDEKLRRGRRKLQQVLETLKSARSGRNGSRR